MDESTAQVLTGALGVFGTLAGGVVGHLLAGRSEKARLRREDSARWLVDQRLAAARFIAAAKAVEKAVYDAAAFLQAPEGSERDEWLDGAMNLLASPESGTGHLCAGDRAILLELDEEIMAKLEVLMELEAELSLLLVGTPRAASSDVIDAALTAGSNIEAYAPAKVAYEAVFDLRRLIDAFVAEVQQLIRVASSPSRTGA